jgi:SAM-dependent methyltransferase
MKCPACGSAGAKPIYKVDTFQIVKCKSCKFAYLQNPPDSEKLYDQYYDRDYKDPENYRCNSSDPQLAELWSINTRRVSEVKRMKPEGKLLDVGCGYGFFMKSAVLQGFDVFGIDISDKAVEYAGKFLKLPASTMTIDELNGSGRKFQIITFWHVLEHYPDPYRALEKVRNLLTEDGTCIIEVPNLRSLKFILSRNKWKGGNHPLYHRSFFTSSTLRRALNETGFSGVARLNISYSIPGRNYLYEIIKSGLNRISCDSFLAFAARK